MTSAKPYRKRSAERGGAMVEFALTVPLLVTMLMFSIFLCEIARVKLKLQEASRYAAWEMTSYILNDYANKNHTNAFNLAMNKTLTDVRERYKDLDSVEDQGPPSMVFDYDPMTVTITDQTVPFLQTNIPGLGNNAGVPGASSVIGAVNRGLNGILGFWGFNAAGQVQVDVQMSVHNKFLGRGFLDGPMGLFNVDQHGGLDLSSFRMNNRFTVVANAWNLADGGDATYDLGAKSTGRHTSGNKNHGMFVQVKRMSYMGLSQLLNNIPGFSAVSRFLPINPLATYVVSHNYKHEATRSRNCNLPKHVGAGKGESGLVNQFNDPVDILDHDLQRCFDTSPFRDTHTYESSLYRNIFKNRGEWFMGCQNDQADDPTITQVYSSDKHKAKEVCATNPATVP